LQHSGLASVEDYAWRQRLWLAPLSRLSAPFDPPSEVRLLAAKCFQQASV
jgi:hypothetical protein